MDQLTNKNRKNTATLVTPEGRVSFPHVFKPSAFSPEQEPKYSLTLLFPKGTDLTPLRQAAVKAAKEKWGDNIPKNLRNPIRDGDEKDLDSYAGMMFISTISKQKPSVVDRNVQPILEQGEFYAGCWAKVSVRPYAYGGPGTKYRAGVSFGLQNIQKIRDDEPFSGRTTAEDDFEPVEGGSEDAAAYETENTDIFG